jgi:alpha/beta superfamily hydrolase
MVKIDAMFFTATEEPLVLVGDKDFEKSKYLDFDTVILCNPNAMAYQNMINYPHAYYLKFFLNKQINCLVWNYRGYGRTPGSPVP